MSKHILLVILSTISIYTHAESFPGEEKTLDMPTATTASSPPIEASPVLDLNAFSTIEQIIPILAK